MYQWPRTPYEKAHWRASVDVRAPDDFRYLPNVRRLLPEDEHDDPAWARYVDVVAAKSACSKGGLLGGYNPEARGAKRFTPEEMLQICLLRTSPFAFKETLTTHQDKIQDLRPGGALYKYKNRPELVRQLAQALWDYECWCRALGAGSQDLARSIGQHLHVVKAWVNAYLSERKHRRLSKRPRLPVTRSTIEEAFACLDKVIETITPEDYVTMGKLSFAQYRNDLVAKMWKSFRQDDLAQRYSREYSEDAAWHAIAAVLLELGVERSPVEDEDEARKTVVWRIRKRLEISTSPAE